MIADDSDEGNMRLVRAATLGSAGVGKTCLIMRMKDGLFPDSSTPTISSFIQFTTTHESEKIKIVINDTAGQEVYRSITQLHYRNCPIILLCFDLNSEKSFADLPSWYDDIKKYNDTAKIILIGTKSDLEQKVEQEVIKQFASMIKAVAYIETSSMTGENTDVVTHTMCNVAIESDIGKEKPIDVVSIEQKQPEQNKKANCC